MKKQRRTLVIGLGNPLIGDDSFGTRVIERLRQFPSELPPRTTLANCHTDLLNQIERFPEYDFVVIVDAMLDPEGKLGPPGRIVVLDEELLLSAPETSPSVHQVSPLLDLKLFRSLCPESQTRITALCLCVDQIRSGSGYLTDGLVAEAAMALTTLID